MAITQATHITNIETRYNKYVAAEAAILDGAQSYTIGNRTLTRADLKWISQQIEKLYNQLLKYTAGKGPRVQNVIMTDYR